MPPFKKISSLNDICIEWVWQWLFHCLKDQATPQNRIKQREFIVSTLNPNIRQQLLNHVCKAHMYRVHISSKCFLLELLGDKTTHCVDLTESGYCYVDDVLQLYRTFTFSLILNLTKLGIVCNVRLRNDRRHVPDLNVQFYRIFNQMSHLRWLTLSGLADLTIMGILGNNCQHLEYLDVSSSELVNDDGIARLVLKDPAVINGRRAGQIARMELDTKDLCETLRVICVSGTNISMMGAVILLRFLTNLRSLAGPIDCGPICHTIALLQQEEEVKAYQFEELNEPLISPLNASLLCITCPKITRFTTCMRSMPALHILHPLQSLTIEDVRGDPWCIYNYLEKRGDTLKELILADNITCPLDLAWVMELTPNLERLQSNIMIEEGLEVPDWKMLKVASITVNSSKVLIALLTHTPALKELTITFSPEPYSETSDCLNDDLFIYIALSDGLKNLEKLMIKDCALSIRCIDCLLMHCPELWYFAHLIYWQKVSQDDIERLRSEAVQNNWKLKLIISQDWERETAGK